MSRLAPDEMILLQMVITPHYSWWPTRLYNKILKDGHAVFDHKLRHVILEYWWIWTISILYGSLTNDLEAGAALALALFAMLPFVSKRDTPIQPAQQHIFDDVLEKLAQPLFRADIRMLVVADSKQRSNMLSEEIITSIGTLRIPGFQGLKIKQMYPAVLGRKIGMYAFTNRLPSLLAMSTNILASSELADIFHFPYGDIRSEDIARTHSRTLPAPTAIKTNEDTTKFDVVLGINEHHSSVTNIGLTAAERQRHTYIVGGTGNGKTTMLEYAVEQDIRNGKGVAVIDPHGDFAQKMLGYIPKERIKDVIYFNPSDLAFPIGINLLELPKGITDEEMLIEKDFITEAIVSMFRKIFSDDDSGGHRIEYILRNAVHTAMTVEDATLFTVLKLLRNTSYRKEVTSKLADEDLRDFWREEIGKAGDFQRVKMSAGITSKIDRFRRSASVKAIIDQPRSTINFDEILDGKILICNVAKGLIGEDTSELLGIGILTKIQLAAYRRIRKSKEQRPPFFVYVDEFQNFATTQFLQMLSEARKYGLVLTMAEQSTSQQDQRMVEVILNNIGTLVCFRTGSNRDEHMLLPHFTPYINRGEIASLPAYAFYIRMRASKVHEPMSGMTVVLKDLNNAKAINKVLSHSRKKYAFKPQNTKGVDIKLRDSSTKRTRVPQIQIPKKSIELSPKS